MACGLAHSGVWFTAVLFTPFPLCAHNSLSKMHWVYVLGHEFADAVVWSRYLWVCCVLARFAGQNTTFVKDEVFPRNHPLPTFYPLL